MQPQQTELTLEQQFELRAFETQVMKMSHTQAQQFLIKLYEQMLVRDAMYRQMLKHEWGIGPTPKL